MTNPIETRTSPVTTTDVELQCPLWKQPVVRAALLVSFLFAAAVSVIALGGYASSRIAHYNEQVAIDGAARAMKDKHAAENDAQNARNEAGMALADKRTSIKDYAPALSALHFGDAQLAVCDGNYLKARFELASAMYANENVDARSVLWQFRHSSVVNPITLAWKESHEAVAVSDDGTVIAATSTNGRLYLWERQNGEFGAPRVINVVMQDPAAQNDSSILESVAIDSGNRRVAVGARSGDVSVLSFSGDSQFVTKRGAAKWLLFAPNGRWLIGGGSSSIRIWNTADWEEFELAHGTDCTAIAFDATSRFLGAGLNRQLAIWELTDDSPAKWRAQRTSVEKGVIRSVAVFTLGGKASVMAGTDSVSTAGETPHGFIYTFDLLNNSLLPELKWTRAVRGDVRSIGGDKRFPWYAIVRGQDGRSFLWDIWSGTQMGWLPKGRTYEFSWMGVARLSPFGNIAAVGRNDSELLVFEPLAAIGTTRRFRWESKVLDLRFRPGRDTLAVGLADGRVVFHDTIVNHPVSEWQAFDGVGGQLPLQDIHGKLGFTSNGNRIAASRQNRIRLFELVRSVRKPEQIGPDLVCLKNIAGVHFVDGGATLLTGSQNLVRHKLESPDLAKSGTVEIAIEEDESYATDLTAMGVSIRGQYGAFAEREGTVVPYTLNAEFRPPFRVNPGSGDFVLGVAVSPDDKWIVTTQAVWSIEDQGLQRRQLLHDQYFGPCDVDFSPSGDLLAAVGDGLRLWRPSDWSKPIVDLRLRDTHWSIVRFSSNGRSLAVADGAGIVQLFDVSELIAWFQQSDSSLALDELKIIGRRLDDVIAADRRLGSIKWLRENPEPH